MFTSCFHDQRFTRSNKVSIKIVKIIFSQKNCLVMIQLIFWNFFDQKPRADLETYKLKGIRIEGKNNFSR